ncbi:LOB domain-containing protein 29-like [Asparagus officinalis]|uniref:LOB domain-containing protein 29-like n=1 Tax=Asparagus officinalis TaxID=4686 RepID=UPI00098E4A81|nr:LOB domain-containing protein 29-like [Asparagus officinalis]
MSGFGSPCGACKFLRRKCVQGCVFAPYFCHEQGAAHFAAIHKVFGASNASKLLSHLPASDRLEAALTISYEAQARLQDPIYGCVSHIFALQQQVVNLQAQLASLKAQTAQNSQVLLSNPSNSESMLCYNNNYVHPNMISNNNYGIGEGSSYAVDMEDLQSVAYAYLYRHT